VSLSGERSSLLKVGQMVEMVEMVEVVYFKVDKNRDTLSAFRGRNHIKAENGKAGEGRKKYGRKGKSCRSL